MLPVLNIDTWDKPFAEATLSQFARLLPEFIATRRWYRSKARQIQSAEIRDVIAIGNTRHYILISRIQFADGDADEYVLALGLLTLGEGKHGQSPAELDSVIATYKTGDGREGNVYDAFSDAEFRTSLLKAIACETKFDGQNGTLIASQTSALGNKRESRHVEIESAVSKAEQSNTSIIYGDRFILKVFRKLEVGINPDVEIGVFLTEHGFKNTPAVLGTLEYRSKKNSEVCAAGILQEFVRNQGDAWKYTLGTLGGFFERALSRKGPAPDLKSHHPMDLMTEELRGGARDLLGDYADSAHLLGVRTAQMHAALADPNSGPNFAPEPFALADGAWLYEEMLSQADIAFELLRRKQAMLTDTATENAQSVLHLEHLVMERFSPLRDRPADAVRIRFHGDFHLGQVLYTGSDFMIIDFEGEPARPLSQRRAKGLAMRDVAGMIRSFQYAAYAALFGQVPGAASGPESTAESWADFWTVWVSAIYLNGYFRAANASPFVPADLEQRRVLFDAFLLQKALYEVAYELNNRPDWVRIPLRGILSLIS